MITFENSIVINQPVHDTFNFIANFENTPLWNYYVRKVTQLTDGPIGVGTHFHQIRKTDEQTYRIIEFEHDRSITIRTTPASRPAFTARYQFEPVGGQSMRLTNVWQLALGMNPILEHFAKGQIASAFSENLDKLKVLLESGSVILQDKRHVVLHQ
jgi:uncharacterized membrane protein